MRKLLTLVEKLEHSLDELYLSLGSVERDRIRAVGQVLIHTFALLFEPRAEDPGWKPAEYFGVFHAAKVYTAHEASANSAPPIPVAMASLRDGVPEPVYFCTRSYATPARPAEMTILSQTGTGETDTASAQAATRAPAARCKSWSLANISVSSRTSGTHPGRASRTAAS